MKNKDLIQKAHVTQVLMNTLTKSLPQYIFWKDVDSIYLGCNQNYAELMGLASPEEIVGKTDRDLPWQKTGDTHEVFIAGDQETLSGHPITNKEEILALPDGRVLITLVSKLPIIDEKGQALGIVGYFTDITENRKNQESLQKIKHQLKGAELISASIAHEIRTPLATIKSGVMVLQKKTNKLINFYEKVSEKIPNDIKKTDIPDIKECINLINKKTDQCNIIINMLLTKLTSLEFNTNEFGKCSADECISSALETFIMPDFMSNKVNYNPEKNFAFLGNKILIVHVIMNLLKNSIFYIQKAGKGEIYIWFENHLENNQIHFKDTALGIPEKFIKSIFKPFFTTESSTGSGVGLAFSKMVMEANQGSINCISEEGVYTEFILTFLKTNEQ